MTSAPPFVTIDRRADGVAILRIDREPRNELNTVVLNEIKAAAERLTADPPGAVVIWGGGRLFSPGGDSAEFEHLTPKLGRLIGETFQEATDALAAIPRVTIAAITGVALGGGCELALACDFRVAANDARIGQPEVQIGTIPGGGGTQRLPRLVGTSVAKELILSGEPVSAERASRIGLVNRVVPARDVLDTALAWAAGFADGPLGAQALAKQAVDRGLDRALDAGLALERDLFTETFADLRLDDHAAAFGDAEVTERPL